MAKDNRIIVVTNRLPFSCDVDEDRVRLIPSAGGLITGIGTIYPKNDTHLWIGWAGAVVIDKTNENRIKSMLNEKRFEPVFMSKKMYIEHYNGYCNQVLWPILHGFTKKVVYQQFFWESYIKVNKKFCKHLLATYTKTDIIWIHDFHLMLLPTLLRKKIPTAKIGFFLHTPFPLYEDVCKVPEYIELIKGLLGADLIGFSILSYKLNFIETLKKIGYEVYDDRFLIVNGKQINIDVFPIGIDFKAYEKLSLSAQVSKEVQRIGKLFTNEKLILSIDRLDYIKGIPAKLKAFELFLQNNKSKIGKVQLLLIVVPSRVEIEDYKILKTEIEELVTDINNCYKELSWLPIIYRYNSFSLVEISSFYKSADIMLVTSLKDGMNLVCKEYIASRENYSGVLVLSEEAGASDELKEAILIKPGSLTNVARGIEKAINMSLDEQQQRMKILKKKISLKDVFDWNRTFLEKLEEI
ncbi:trehalose-6-phosphate synthase [Flavobacterium tructae]|uniref:alpha,alpha-trehalose-phosphate synthase (UDP-forming) n=1 Tax=Flavobacterium tructae TaxID=1114873 RepID=UPI0035A94ADB